MFDSYILSSYFIATGNALYKLYNFNILKQPSYFLLHKKLVDVSYLSVQVLVTLKLDILIQ